MNFLIVRLGALGDIVHTVPAAAALRRARPDARIDWVVDARHASFVRLVDGIDRVVALERPTVAAWIQLVQMLRPARYDVALDFQGLMKSALIARASGARRVVGFSIWHLREKGARPSIRTWTDGAAVAHVVQKNLRLLSLVGVETTAIEFPLRHSPSPVLAQVKHEAAGRRIALINRGRRGRTSGWRPRDSARSRRSSRRCRPGSVRAVGPGEQSLAQEVVDASGCGEGRPGHHDRRSARALARRIADRPGDTGPLHIAAAAGTPIVAIFGPTDPDRNGPWDPDDVVGRAMAPAAVTISANAAARRGA